MKTILDKWRGLPMPVKIAAGVAAVVAVLLILGDISAWLG